MKKGWNWENIIFLPTYSMVDQILAKLLEIRDDNSIRILFSCESGSRGWEFPSPDSDYDVRFIYCRPFDYYLSVAERSYDLRFPINDELDIYGWDIRKVLQLTRKSNTTPFEWLQSPIVYMEEPGFKDNLWKLSQGFFNQRSNIHHYLGIAQNALNTSVDGENIKIKKLFYVLRPLLAAKWCLDRKSIAPMRIGELLEDIPKTISEQVKQLIEMKATLAEGYQIAISPSLMQFIHVELTRISEASKLIEPKTFGLDALDQFFVSTIRKA